MENQEQALPPMQLDELKRVARLYRASTGVGADGFHLEVSLDLSSELCESIIVFAWRR